MIRNGYYDTIFLQIITDFLFVAKRYPWYGFQWQPEKSQFEFNTNMAADHSIYAIMMSQYIANFFVSEAKQNTNHFKSAQEEEANVISRSHTFYVGNITDTEFEQIYVFDMKKHYGFTIKTERNVPAEKFIN